MLEPEAQSQLVAPSTTRLVIRVKLIPQQPPRSARLRLSRSALVTLFGALAVLLSWSVISTFGVDPPPPAAATKTHVISKPPPSRPAAETTERSVEPEVQPPPDAPTSAINEVIPDVPQSAQDTIRGTVRVSIRVTVDKQGVVVDAAADDPVPSRYFERLAVGASKKWTFTPTNSQGTRMMLVKFSFTRERVSAQASPLQ